MPLPLSLGGVVVPLDYSTRDYEGYRADALALAPLFTPEWTDFYPTDPGVVLVEEFAYIGDNLSYYIDRAANESFISTLTQRRSMINLGRLHDYELRPATSALVVMQFTTNASGTISAGEQVSTDPVATGEDAVIFEVKVDVTVGAAGTFDVDCIQGTSVTDEILGSGGGLPSTEFNLARSPLSLDPAGTSSLKVFVDEGSGFIQYVEVANFTESEPLDQHFTTRIDEDDNVTIRFGNGVNGIVVAGGVNNVKATYRVGGGASGNSVGGGTLTKYLASNPIVVSVTNGTNVPQGGDDKETLDEARDNIPGSLRAMDRAITHEDYEVLAKRGVGGVAQAKAVWGIGPFEEVVYVAAEGADPVAAGTWDPILETGTGLIGQVGDYLSPRKASPIRLVVRPPSRVRLEFAFALELYDGFFQADVETEVTEALLETTVGLRMGEDLVLSDFMCVIEGVTGVRKVRFSAFRRQADAVLTNPDPFFIAGGPDTTWAVTPTNADDYAAFILTSSVQPTLQEVLTVRFTSATAYTVSGSESGLQSTVGAVGLTWTHDLGNVTLLATAGSIPNYGGNVYRVTVGSGAVVTHIAVGEYEVATLAEADITITDTTGGIV